MDEKSAWEQFEHSGKVTDYLSFAMLKNESRGNEINAVKNQGNCAETAQYR